SRSGPASGWAATRCCATSCSPTVGNSCCGRTDAGISVGIVSFGGYLNIVGRASVGDIMAFQWYTFLLLNPVWNIVNSFSELQRSLAAMERVFEVLAMAQDMPDRQGATDAPPVVQELQFQHVEFEYRP